MKRILALTLLLAVAAPGALADPIGKRVDRARQDQRSAQGTLQQLEGELASIQSRLTAAQGLLDEATVRLVDARSEERDAQVRLAIARDTMLQRVRLAYEQGPASTLDMLLSARSTSDFLSINEFTSHVLSTDLDAIAEVSQGKQELRRLRQGLQVQRQTLSDRQREVQGLLDEMQGRVQQAQDAARQAGLRVASLEDTAQRIAAQRARETERAVLLSGPGTGDQAKLLALLGPNGGRGCDIPSGLRATGGVLSGEASWYGSEFAGQGTASGAPFDPSLFTAAHRTLPLGVFLRVHHGGKCAIVLVNDRGPYGDYSRIIDLAQAPAQYLGVGVSQVTADILVSR